MPYERNADMDDLPHTEWKCEFCGAENSCLDGECQFCDASKIEPLIAALIDFVVMARNECQRIRKGHAPGPSMRDCVGQWEATIREAQNALEEYKLSPAQKQAVGVIKEP